MNSARRSSELSLLSERCFLLRRRLDFFDALRGLLALDLLLESDGELSLELGSGDVSGLRLPFLVDDRMFRLE
jgi:hypothetical protein